MEWESTLKTHWEIFQMNNKDVKPTDKVLLEYMWEEWNIS